jgi:hypothetical protein
MSLSSFIGVAFLVEPVKRFPNLMTRPRRVNKCTMKKAGKGGEKRLLQEETVNR